MTQYCPSCESGKLSKHRTFDREEKWTCNGCDRVFSEAGEEDVADHNDISEGDLVLNR